MPSFIVYPVLETLELTAIAILSFFGMEFLARFLHKYVMHGALWFLHEDHHREKQARLEKNDAFGIIFAGIAIFLFIEWLRTGNPLPFAVAVGMTAYGAAYVIVHDMIIHDRHLHLRSWGLRHQPFRTLILVHDVHHSEGRGNWGFLLVIRGIDKVPEELRQKA
jgi:beta-carotene 3-hydroxylase